MLRPNKWFSWSRSNSSSIEALRIQNKPHSLEHLKYLHNLLEKNQTVNENNRTLLVETLRRIAEILIWGDQNDSTVFDFFLEKNMLYFFLQIMKQKCGGYVCTQLLQTLNILFENIKNETSLYYLLSNNHVNSIIVHKFDFDNEEVMAYYISFLKTLSLKLNNHTVHFFFNEHTADFPLYTEAIKFFNHPEKMVRIAVRTLTLNVFRVREKAMIRFIRDCTAAPYFSNLSWFIGNNVLDIGNSVDSFTRKDSRNSPPKSDSILINRIEDFVAEHLDHLHYLNDILRLKIDDLNSVLSDNLFYRLITPLYIHSFLTLLSTTEYTKEKFTNLELSLNRLGEESSTSSKVQIKAILCPPVAMFLLTQAHLILTYGPLLNSLVVTLLRSTNEEIEQNAKRCEFTQPNKSLEAAIEQAISSTSNHISVVAASVSECGSLKSADSNSDNRNHSDPHTYCEQRDDEERVQISPEVSCCSSISSLHSDCGQNCPLSSGDWFQRPFLVLILATLNSSICLHKDGNDLRPLSAKSEKAETDSASGSLFKSCHSPQVSTMIPELQYHDDRIILFTLSLISSIICNNAIRGSAYQGILTAHSPSATANEYETQNSFCTELLNSLLFIIRQCCSKNPNIRLVTFELAVDLFKRIVFTNRYKQSGDAMQTVSEAIFITDHQLALLEQANEDASHLLRQYFCSVEKSVFLELFENEAKIAAAAMMSDAKDSLSKSPTSSLASIASGSNKIWSHNFELNLEKLFMDSTLLFSPKHISQVYPNSNSNFYLRLPSHDYERTRYAIQVFFILRRLSFDIRSANTTDSEDDGAIEEKQFDFSTLLVDSTSSASITLDQFIDLENCDLNACSVKFYYPVNQSKSFGMNQLRKSNSHFSNFASGSPSSNKKIARFMTIIGDLVILIEPDEKRYGWGVIRFIARLQDMELLPLPQAIAQITTPVIPEKEKDDVRSIYAFFRRHLLSYSLTDSKYAPSVANKSLSESASIIVKFSFDDTIRSLAAMNNLKKAQKKELCRKMAAIGKLIDLKSTEQPSEQPSPDVQCGKKKNYHHLLNRTYAIPGVAVQSKFKDQSSLASTSQNVAEMLNKKRYAYPASQTKIKITNSRMAADNERKRKLKPKLSVVNDDADNGIPLNDLSPKTIRKNKVELSSQDSGKPESRSNPEIQSEPEAKQSVKFN